MQKEKLNIELSYKLFDAVANSKNDGMIFTSNMRNAYIERAFRRLIKILEDVNDPNLELMFKDIYKVEKLPIGEDSTIDAEGQDGVKAIYIEKIREQSIGVELS